MTRKERLLTSSPGSPDSPTSPYMKTDGILSPCCSQSYIWCWTGTHSLSFVARSTSVSFGTLTGGRCYEIWQKIKTCANGLVTLTFSPGRPLSPTVPGSVRPGKPYIIHRDVSTKPYSSTLNSLRVISLWCSLCLRKKLAKGDKQTQHSWHVL